jgi:hypothetical protein
MFTKVPGGWVEIDREPQFKVGDKVKLHTIHWFGPTVFNGKVTMVGIYDTELYGGIPGNPGYPALVYGYSVEVERDGGIFLYKGVPEFFLTRSGSRKNK